MGPMGNTLFEQTTETFLNKHADDFLSAVTFSSTYV